jgi:hypothetical protein
MEIEQQLIGFFFYKLSYANVYLWPVQPKLKIVYLHSIKGTVSAQCSDAMEVEHSFYLHASPNQCSSGNVNKSIDMHSYGV